MDPDHPFEQRSRDVSPVSATPGIATIGITLGVTVEIETPALLPDLIGRLAASGCMTNTVDDRVCRVVHLHAVDAVEEWYEIHFFLRAWQAHHGVEATLRPDWGVTRRPERRTGLERRASN
jgi:hypothetical protein